MADERLGGHTPKTQRSHDTLDSSAVHQTETVEGGFDSLSFDSRQFCQNTAKNDRNTAKNDRTNNDNTDTSESECQESKPVENGALGIFEGPQLPLQALEAARSEYDDLRSLPLLDKRVLGPCINAPLDENWGDRLVVVGSGAYGTAFCSRIASCDRDAIILGRDEEVVRDINLNRRNSKNLMGLDLSMKLKATTSTGEAYCNRGVVVLAVPSLAIASVMQDKVLHEDTIIVSMAKGLIIEGWDYRDPRYSLSKGPPSDVVIRTPLQYLAQHESTKHIKNLAVVAGPGFAADIVSGNVLDLTVGGTNSQTIEKVCELFLHSGNYTYTTGTRDTIGVELSSVMKNVIAVMVGICDRLREYDGTRCFPANVTEFVKRLGIAESARLIKHLGGKPKTLNEAAGWADLNLTTSSTMGRNFSLGRLLADGAKIDEVVRREGKVVEGAWSAWAVKRMADDMQGKLGVYMPVTNALVDIFRGASPATRLEKLLNDTYMRQLEGSLGWKSGKGVEVVKHSSSSKSSDVQLH